MIVTLREQEISDAPEHHNGSIPIRNLCKGISPPFERTTNIVIK